MLLARYLEFFRLRKGLFRLRYLREGYRLLRLASLILLGNLQVDRGSCNTHVPEELVFLRRLGLSYSTWLHQLGLVEFRNN